MTVGELYAELEKRVPRALSCDWDNDGLMCCPDPGAEVRRVLVALDVTGDTVRRAIDGGYALIVSLHTRLDAVEGGVNDTLANLLGLRDVTPFGDGIGRVGILDYAYTLCEFAEKVKSATGAPAVLCADAGRTVSRGGGGHLPHGRACLPLAGGRARGGDQPVGGGSFPHRKPGVRNPAGDADRNRADPYGRPLRQQPRGTDKRILIGGTYHDVCNVGYSRSV